MNGVTIKSERQNFEAQKIHAADKGITSIFSFEILHGCVDDFNTSPDVVAILSDRAATLYTGSADARGKRINLYTFGDTLTVCIAAVFKSFPSNTHEDFDVLISYQADAIQTLSFNADETGVYGRALVSSPAAYNIRAINNLQYRLQPLPKV